MQMSLVICLFLIASAIFFGFSVMSALLSHKVDRFSCVCIGIPFGITVSSWIFYIFNLWIPLSFMHGILHSLCLIAIGLSLLLFKPSSKHSHEILPTPTLIIGVIAPFIVLSLFIKFSMMYDGNWTRGACYGDLPFHLNLISSFAYGCNSKRRWLFDIISPFYALEPLAYPFIPNFYSAVLLSCSSVSFHVSLIVPSFALALSLFGVLAKIVFLFTRDQISACLAPWLFLMLGGMGFLRFFDPTIRSQFYVDYVHNLGNDTTGTYFQTVLHVLLPQRASLHSLPIAWSVILALMVSGNEVDARLFAGIGLLIASLPQVQGHSIISLAQWGFAFAVLRILFKKPLQWKATLINYSILAVIAITLGFPQCIPYMKRVGGMLHFIPIWKPEKDKNFISFWWQGLGCFFFTSMVSGPLILTKKQLVAFLPSVFVFIISNFVMYQPWNLDNTKVLNSAWMPIAIAVSSQFISFIFRAFPFYGKLVGTLLMMFCCASGFLALKMAATESNPLWDVDERHLELAEWVKNNTPRDAVFITDPYHNHPVVALAGRQTVLGYGGWVASHGLDFNNRWNLILKVLRNPDVKDGAELYKVRYVCTNNGDSKGIRFSPAKNTSIWKEVYNNRFVVYQRIDDL